MIVPIERLGMSPHQGIDLGGPQIEQVGRVKDTPRARDQAAQVRSEQTGPDGGDPMPQAAQLGERGAWRRQQRQGQEKDRSALQGLLLEVGWRVGRPARG
jgi:hypothetical protein